MRGDDRQLHLRAQRQRGPRLRGVALVAGAVQFEEVAPRERGRHPLGGQPGGLELAGEQQRTHVAVAAAGQRDQALREAAVPFLEPLEPHLGATAVLVLEIRPRQQVAEVQVARAILGEDGQAERVVTIGVVRDPQVAADDRLDTLLAGGGVEAHRPEELALSVRASAPCPSRTAFLTASSIRTIPSTTENSEWRRRWTKRVLLIGGILPPGRSSDCG